MIVEIKSAIIIIDFVFAPASIMISGPSATLGRLFNIVRYGSRIFSNLLLNHRMLEIIKPIIFPRIKLINISSKVVNIWINKLFDL